MNGLHRMANRLRKEAGFVPDKRYKHKDRANARADMWISNYNARATVVSYSPGSHKVWVKK